MLLVTSRAWNIALLGGKKITDAAIGRGIDDALDGSEFSKSRRTFDHKPDYGLGYAIGRFVKHGMPTPPPVDRHVQFKLFEQSDEYIGWRRAYPHEASKFNAV